MNVFLPQGVKKSAIEGLELLKELNRIAAGQPTIMPGGGINPQSIIQIKAAGFTQVHFSGTVFEDLGTSLPFSFKTEAFLERNKNALF